jgi:hypothetical protein
VTESLSIKNNTLRNKAGRIVAEVPEELGPEGVSSYLHLFACAQELLDFFEAEIGDESRRSERAMIPKPTLIGYISYTGSHRLPDMPGWIDPAIYAMSVAYGESKPESINGLSIAAGDEKALQNDYDEIVVQIPWELDEDDANDYLNLFLASAAFLEILDTMIEREYGEIGRRPAENQLVSTDIPAYRPMISDELQRMSDLAAKAKGAIPARFRE